MNHLPVQWADKIYRHAHKFTEKEGNRRKEDESRGVNNKRRQQRSEEWKNPSNRPTERSRFYSRRLFGSTIQVTRSAVPLVAEFAVF